MTIEDTCKASRPTSFLLAWRNRPDETPLGILTYGENPRRLAFPATQQHGPRTKTRV